LGGSSCLVGASERLDSNALGAAAGSCTGCGENFGLTEVNEPGQSLSGLAMNTQNAGRAASFQSNRALSKPLGPTAPGPQSK
jgi:hypothetical protein